MTNLGRSASTSQSRKLRPGQLVTLAGPKYTGPDQFMCLVLDKLGKIHGGDFAYRIMMVASDGKNAVVIEASGSELWKLDHPPMTPFVRAEYPMTNGVKVNRFAA